MSSNELRFSLLIVLAFIMIGLGCSSGGEAPVTTPDTASNLISNAKGDTGRVLWGIWEIRFDPARMSVEVVPVRDIQLHYDITTMILPPACSNCLVITINSFDTHTRILDADVKLYNPYPIAGHDVRGILFTNSAGHELTNPDNWTALWDKPGGKDINPFKAYAKDEANRLFAGKAEHTEKFLLKMPNPPQYNAIKFAVDASWPGNCREPYEINNFEQEIIEPDVGASGGVSVDVRDWQGDVSEVTINAQPITGEETTQLTHLSADTWGALLTNNAGVPAGDYETTVAAKSANSGNIILYDIVNITISGIPDAPVEVTPPWLNFAPMDICVEGSYAYIAGDANGFHIFNISNPSKPVWVNKVKGEGRAVSLTVSGGYAYMLDYKLEIIDIDPPESAYLVKGFDLGALGFGIDLSGNYAYIACGESLRIVDISLPESPLLVKSIDMPPGAGNVAVANGYAFVADGDNGIQVVDIEPPESAYVAKTVDTPGKAYDVELSDGYAYVADGGSGFQVMDIDPIDAAAIVKTVDMEWPSSLTISGNYAYVTNVDLQIVDISTPEEATVVKSVDIPVNAAAVDVQNGYAYIADEFVAIRVVDVTPPESAEIVGSAETLGHIHGGAYCNGYVFMGDSSTGVKTVDVDPPESAYLYKTIGTNGSAARIAVDSGYAYVADWNAGLTILDIDPVESAYIAKSVGPFYGVGVAYQDGYAYVPGDNAGLNIVDVDPIESASVVKNISTPDYAKDIAVSGSIAVLAIYDSGVQIIDISVPESASVINTVDTPGKALNVDICGDYAYVADYISGIQIIDISTPGSADICGFIPCEYAYDVVVSNGYAYIADLSAGLVTADVDPPGSAHILATVHSDGSFYGVFVSGSYAYLCKDYGGLGIFKLW